MELAERQGRYKSIEAYRERPLIVYATSTRQGVQAFMAGDAVRELIDQVDAIRSGDGVDILIHSTGGDALAAWKLISLLRERFRKISVLVPSAAFSAATIFALGADEIVMHPHASLGPIDPQIIARLPDGTTRSFSYEDVGSFLKFVTTEASLKDENCIAPVLQKLFEVADPLMVGAAKRASGLSSEVGKRMLLTHMEKKSDAERIATDLNTGFFAHGDAISRTRALEIGLKVSERDAKLEDLIWQAYLGLESQLELRKPFNPLELYLANPERVPFLVES